MYGGAPGGQSAVAAAIGMHYGVTQPGGVGGGQGVPMQQQQAYMQQQQLQQQQQQPQMTAQQMTYVSQG